MNDSMEKSCLLAVSHLKELNVKVLAIDFDLTIINVHTGGKWKESSHELSNYVRPLFKTLIPAANQSGILIAVVTFSRQVDLIKEVLLQSMKNNEFVEFIPIEGGIPHDYRSTGKKRHIRRVAKKLQETYPGLELHPSSILLIDDDLNNISLAEKQGFRSIPLFPESPEEILQNIMKLH